MKRVVLCSHPSLRVASANHNIRSDWRPIIGERRLHQPEFKYMRFFSLCVIRSYVIQPPTSLNWLSSFQPLVSAERTSICLPATTGLTKTLRLISQSRPFQELSGFTKLPAPLRGVSIVRSTTRRGRPEIEFFRLRRVVHLPHNATDTVMAKQNNLRLTTVDPIGTYNILT